MQVGDCFPTFLLLQQDHTEPADNTTTHTKDCGDAAVQRLSEQPQAVHAWNMYLYPDSCSTTLDLLKEPVTTIQDYIALPKGDLPI